MNIVVHADNPNSTDCKGCGPIRYATVNEVVDRIGELNRIFGVNNWSAWMSVRIPINTDIDEGE